MSGVRPAERRDLPRCREIQDAALAEPWPGLLSTALDSGATVLVHDESGTVLGYVVALVATAEPAYVPEFAVHPARQDEGVGSGLMTALCERLAADGHETVRLTVHAADERARAFYRRHGFEVVERRPDHFADGDGLLLARPLDDAVEAGDS